MEKIPKRLSWVIVLIMSIAVVVTFSLYSCKVEGEAEEAVEEVEKAEEAVEEEKPTLTIWEWHSTEVPDTMEQVYSQFEQQTGIKLDVQTLAWEDNISKISIASEAGELPDLIEMSANFLLLPLVVNGSLEPLDNYIEEENRSEFLDRFKPNSILEVGGQIYSLPVLLWKHDMIYNPNIFGNDYDPPTNWQELEGVAKALTDKDNGIYGFGIPGASSETLLYFADFIAQNGGYIGLPSDFPRVPEEIKLADIGINNAEALEAIEFALKLVKEYGPPFANASSKEIRDLFTAGNLAMMYEGADAIVFLAYEGMGFEIQTASMPIGPLGKPAAVNCYGDCQFAMSANSEHKEEAWEFLKFITSDDIQVILTKGTAMVAAVKGDADEALLSEHPRMQPAIESLNASEPDWYVIDFYSQLPPQVQVATDIFNTEIQKVYLGNQSLQEAMDKVANDWIGLWDKWRSEHGTMD